MEVHVHIVEAMSHAGNVQVKDNENTKRPKRKENQLGILSIFKAPQN